MRKLATLLAIALVAGTAGCGDDDDEGSPGTVARTTPNTPAPAPADGCFAAGGRKIEVVKGDVACPIAQATAAGYDPEAGPVQQLGEWTCEGGDAATPPVLFTCTSRIGEFVVREPGG